MFIARGVSFFLISSTGEFKTRQYKIFFERVSGFSNADEPVLLEKRGGTHGHYPDFQDISTGFVVCGPGINKGMKLQQICLEDIAPVVAKMLGISLPNADGKVVSGIFESKKK